MGLGEDSVPIPTKLGRSGTMQTQKSQLVLTALLGGKELEWRNILGCDVALDVTLDHTQEPTLQLPHVRIFISPGTLPTKAISFPQSILFPQVLKVIPYPSAANGFFLFPSCSGASGVHFLTMCVWDVAIGLVWGR